MRSKTRGTIFKIKLGFSFNQEIIKCNKCKSAFNPRAISKYFKIAMFFTKKVFPTLFTLFNKNKPKKQCKKRWPRK